MRKMTISISKKTSPLFGDEAFKRWVLEWPTNWRARLLVGTPYHGWYGWDEGRMALDDLHVGKTHVEIWFERLRTAGPEPRLHIQVKTFSTECVVPPDLKMAGELTAAEISAVLYAQYFRELLLGVYVPQELKKRPSEFWASKLKYYYAAGDIVIMPRILAPRAELLQRLQP